MTADAGQIAEIKFRLAALLRDLKGSAGQNGQAMAAIGMFGGQLARNYGCTTWRETKDALSPAQYRELITAFHEKGTAHHRAGHPNEAYAIQVLSVSLAAHSLRDAPEVAKGEELLDLAIEHAVANFLALDLSTRH